MTTSQGNTGAGNNRVLIRRCEEYDRDAIERLVREGMHELGYTPSGKVFVKPNVVFSYKGGRYGRTAYTHTDVVGGAVLALSRADSVSRVDIGENAAVGFPTRLCYDHAGYYDEVRRIRKQAVAPVGIFCIDEERRDEAFVGGMVHSTLRIARKMARADSKVYLPKLKCHCVSNMTGAVKLNIGICSDDERSIRHDFLLDDKIVDLLAVGYPDFIVMDAIDVGVGNEGAPKPRRLGLIIMGRNPMAVDLVGARLLGYGIDDVAHLKRAAERRYRPARLEDVELGGDITRAEGLDEQAERIMPYDDDFYRWQDIDKELERLNSPLRFFWGSTREAHNGRCLTGCVMGLKMFLCVLELHAGSEAFGKAKPVVLIIGRNGKEIDARGSEVFMIGTCSRATIVNAKKITRINKCFTTASDLARIVRSRLGIASPVMEPSFLLRQLFHMSRSAAMKAANLRYLEDLGYFASKGLVRRI